MKPPLFRPESTDYHIDGRNPLYAACGPFDAIRNEAFIVVKIKADGGGFWDLAVYGDNLTDDQRVASAVQFLKVSRADIRADWETAGMDSYIDRYDQHPNNATL